MRTHKTKTLALGLSLFLLQALWLPGIALGQTKEAASRVRVLLVFDTHATNADKLGIEKSSRILQDALRDALRDGIDQNRVTFDVLSGADVTPRAVMDYYRNLRTEPSEALMFYYYGHGGCDPDRGHFLAMRRGNLLRSDLRTAMLQHGTRLAVILSDSCGNFPGQRPPRLGAGAGALGDRNVHPDDEVKDRGRKDGEIRGIPRDDRDDRREVRSSALTHLLFHGTGLVDINSARMGTFAWGNARDGGYFTFTLVRLLGERVETFDANRDGMVSWVEFFAVLERETERVAAQISGGRIVQNPEAFTLGEPVVVRR